MSRGRPEKENRSWRGALGTLLLAASAAALLRPHPLHAQETQLRGAVSESGIAEDQKRKTDEMVDARNQAAQAAAQTTSPAPVYQPASPGALPDTTDGSGRAADAGSIFDDPASTDDTFSTDRPSTEYRPSTARLRSQGEPAVANRRAGPVQATSATDTGDPDSDATIANARGMTVDAEEKQSLDAGADRTGAIEQIRHQPEEDPFAATGLRLGSFVLKPTLEQGVTVTTNADSSANGKSAVLSETTLRLNAASDWRENSATADGYLTFRKSVSGQELEDTRGRIEGTLNVDLDNDLRAIAKAGYEAGPESASSPDAIVGTLSQPLRQTIDGSLGIEKEFGKARFAVTGAVERDLYGDAKLSGGGTVSQKDRDSTLYTATLRGGYEISPAITPFAELEVGRRVYDLRFDSTADHYERSANRLGARAGLALDLGEKLNGEVSAGWIREKLDDDRLTPVSGATIDADLKWSPERGTVIGLRGQTTVEGTTTAGESGSILYSGRLTGERQIRANLTANAALGADWRDYMGSNDHDLTLSAEAGLTWWLNRYTGLTSRVRTEKMTSSQSGRDYTANSVFLGLKLQR